MEQELTIDLFKEMLDKLLLNQKSITSVQFFFTCG